MTGKNASCLLVLQKGMEKMLHVCR